MSSACAKFILVGEHGVLHGAKAIAFPLSSMSLSISLRSCHYPTQTPFPVLFKETEKIFSLSLKKISIDICSNIPQQAGLGSSAALVSSFVKAVNKQFSLKISKKKLESYACQLENLFHINSSGVDVATVFHKKAILFQKKGEISYKKFIKISLDDWSFCLLDSQTRSKTHEMIHKSNQILSHEIGSEKLKVFNDITEKAYQALTHRNFNELADSLNKNMVLLQELGLSTSKIDRIILHCKELGALAGKITGAGGGGFVIIFWKSLPSEKIRSILNKSYGQENIYWIKSSR